MFENVLRKDLYFGETRFYGCGILDALTRFNVVPLKIYVVKLKHNKEGTVNHYLFVFQVSNNNYWFIDHATDFSSAGLRRLKELNEIVEKYGKMGVPVERIEGDWLSYWFGKIVAHAKHGEDEICEAITLVKRPIKGEEVVK